MCFSKPASVTSVIFFIILSLVSKISAWLHNDEIVHNLFNVSLKEDWIW